MNATTTAPITFSAAIPAVSFQTVAGGRAVRVRREGKGDTFLLVRDDRARSYDVYLLVMQGQGVVGRVACVDGEWIWEHGVFRNWEATGTPFQVFPSSTVETRWGFANREDAVAEAALYWLS
jgi:hypothetical protein